MLDTSHLEAAFGAATVAKLRAAKVLVVGAGGIGCELLKNLVLSGFENLEVIDLDTIDVSNLNRQFLFRAEHVGHPKSLMAAQVVRKLNPAAKIVAYHANIKEPRFGLTYFSGFDLVINALDNVPARRHVNRLCLAAGKPLIEAGTMGYAGQAYVIRKGETECFECRPKPTQKQYPICTIRSTPDKPVHCVVWAKELHKLLTGDARNSYLFEGTDSPAALAAAAAKAAGGADGDVTDGVESVYMHVVSNPPPADGDVAGWAAAVFRAIFYDEIVKRLSMGGAERYKTAKALPQALDLDALLAEGSAGGAAASAPVSGLRDQQVMTPSQSAALFLSSLTRLYSEPASRATLGAREFSKDDALDLDFVAAATNLRAHTFSIPLQSKWDVKSIAGNIIPAIATTNAIVAGMEVLEAIKIIRGDSVAASCRYTDILRVPSVYGGMLTSSSLAKPNPACYACGTAGVVVAVDTASMTLGDFIRDVLNDALAFNLPCIDNGEDFNFVGERDDEEDDEEYAQKMSFLEVPLANLVGGGLKDGTIATVTDFGQANFSMQLSIRHKPRSEFDTKTAPRYFEVLGAEEAKAKAAAASAAKEAASAAAAAVASSSGARGAGGVGAASGGAGAGQQDDDGDIVIDDDEEGAASSSGGGGGAASGGAGGAGGAAAAAGDDDEDELEVVDVEPPPAKRPRLE